MVRGPRRSIALSRATGMVSGVQLDLKQRTVTISVSYDKSEPVACPACQGQASIYDHLKRSWRHLDTCQLKTIIECEVPRASCEDHGVKQLPVAWAEANGRFTALFEALVISWLKEASISGVAELLQKQIGNDETSFQKRYEYVTVILDRSRDVVVEVLDDRKAETLEGWLRDRPAAHLASVESVTMDMWDPFIKAVRDCIPESGKKICFDRYHVAQHFGKALDKVRAQEHRWLMQIQGASSLSGTKYDWQRNSGRTDNRGRREFMGLSRMNLKTARAWAIKETAARLWNYCYRGAAQKAWGELLGWIARCRLEPVRRVGRMVREYFWGILNAIIARVSNAMAEAKNARIQRIKNMACGYRNRERFRMAILFHLGGLNLMPKTLSNFAT